MIPRKRLRWWRTTPGGKVEEALQLKTKKAISSVSWRSLSSLMRSARPEILRRYTACFRYLCMFPFPSGDLNQMHRINEESYRNPVSKNSGQTQSVSTRDGDTPRAEARAPLSHQISGSVQSLWVIVYCVFWPFFVDRFLSVSLVLAGFGDQPTPQQLHMQSRYKEDLKRQVSPGLQPFSWGESLLGC